MARARAKRWWTVAVVLVAAHAGGCAVELPRRPAAPYAGHAGASAAVVMTPGVDALGLGPEYTRNNRYLNPRRWDELAVRPGTGFDPWLAAAEARAWSSGGYGYGRGYNRSSSSWGSQGGWTSWGTWQGYSSQWNWSSQGGW